jgi:hypothetical protein
MDWADHEPLRSVVARPMVSNVLQFRDLVGLELGSVCFVRDYVELHFDGPVFRSLARRREG